MLQREYAGKQLELTDDGFLVDKNQWTPDIAEAIAREYAVPLSPEHWKVITFCREDAAKEGEAPSLRRIAKVGGIGMKDLYRLFPKGPGKLAAKIAGLPKPQGCI